MNNIKSNDKIIKLKIVLPEKIIVKKNNNYYLDITTFKNLSFFYNYFNQEIDKIITKYKLDKNIHFTHTGKILLFDHKHIRQQTWFESIEGYKCWLPNYIIHKYFNPSYSSIILKKNPINLSNLPKILNYINIVELHKFDKRVIKTLKGYFSKKYKNNVIKKYNVIKRSRYLGRFTSCGKFSLNSKKTDAIIMSSKMLKKSKPKTKILIEIINKYNNNTIINSLELSDKYLNYCNYLSTINFKGYNNFKKLSESYSNNIQKLEIPKIFPNNKNNFIDYHNIIMREITKHIVDKKYKSLAYIPSIYFTNGIPRPNHGVVNIMRQGLFTIKILELFKKRNNQLFKKIFKTNTMIFLVIISSHFLELMRIGDGIRGLNGFGVSKYVLLNNKILKNIFPTIDTSMFDGLDYNNQIIYSGIFLKSFLSMYNIDEKIIDNISSTIYYNLKEKNFKKLGIDNFKFKNNPNHYIILYCVVKFGNFADDCRSPLSSNILEENFIKLLLNTINATYEDRIELFEYIQKIILKTQINSKLIKGSKCIKKTINNNISTKKCCSNIVKSGRYTNKNFKIYSKNYNKLYMALNFNKELKKLL